MVCCAFAGDLSGGLGWVVGWGGEIEMRVLVGEGVSVVVRVNGGLDGKGIVYDGMATQECK